jgi:endonuclease YncB( thermonuclease family)
MPRRLRFALVLVAAMLAWQLPATSSAAVTLHYQDGVVTRIADGDTFRINLDSGQRDVPVRLIGLQATETGTCNAAAATRRLSQLILGKRVRLTSIHTSSTSLGRLLRHVAVRIDGSWRDAGKTLASEGYVLWEPSRAEWYLNKNYHARVARAAATRTGPMWRSTVCGSGPQQTVPVSIQAQWDADGDDNANLNGEYVRVRNHSTTSTLLLTGWALRDGTHYTWWFPTGARIAPGATATVHIGSGTTTSTRFYMRRTTPLFGNPDVNGYGDGAYLLDPHGDVRAHFVYPCGYSCVDRLTGKVDVRAQYDAPGNDASNLNQEYVDVVNTSTASVNLEGYLIRNTPNSYLVGANSVVGPGERLRLHMGQGTDSRLEKYWRRTGAQLANGGETVTLQTFAGVVVDCYAWGTARC